MKITNKTEYFYKVSSDGHYICVCITELWLKQNTLSSELFSSIYNVFHLDRSPAISSKNYKLSTLLSPKIMLKTNGYLAR